MDEAPQGLQIPEGRVAKPRQSVSILLTRDGQNGIEILLAHRIPTLRAFADFWSLPGGGIKDFDHDTGDKLSSLKNVEKEWKGAMAAILRETAEEVGLAIGESSVEKVSMKLRHSIIENPDQWINAVDSDLIPASNIMISHIGTRTTPPFAPLRFCNRFMHAHIPPGSPEPELLDIGSEFDELVWMSADDAIKTWESGNMLTAPPIVTLLRDVAESLSNNEQNINAAISELSSAPPSGEHRIELAPGIECVPIRTQTLPPATHTNCFILGEIGGDRIVIDPAAKTHEELEYLQRRIEAVIEDGGNILATIFTHRHQDHIGDLSRIDEIYSAPIWSAKETFEVIPNFETNRILKDGDILTLKGPSGNKNWNVYITPGHCPGHICLASDQYVISGDLAVMVGTILVPSSDGNMDDYIESLRRIRALESSMLFPAHGPFTHRPAKLLDRYISHREGRHHRVLEALEQGITEIQKIANFAYSDTPDAHPMLKVDQTLSHLISHERAGRIRKTSEGWGLNG
ncbi:MAG: MBL fold metallo-hydrolase [Candidatus Thalassarchaeaceae archaeon]